MAIVNEKIQDIYGLTPLQEGMLFHSLSDDKSTAYVVQMAYKIDCCYEQDLLEAAFHLLAQRYDVLRTMFVYENLKTPRQVVLKDRKIEVNTVDLTGEDSSNYETLIKRILSEDVNRKFDLKNDSLLRVINIKLQDDKSIIVWTSHHIILDGWCNSKLFSVFTNYYSRLKNGEEKENIENEIKEELIKSALYSDYIKWLNGQDMDKAKKYWEVELDGYDNVAEIPTMRSPEQTEEQARELWGELDENTTAVLKRFAEHNEATINTVVER